MSYRLFCLTLVLSLCPASPALAADIASPSRDVQAKLEKALEEKKIDDRLGALVEAGKSLSISDISQALISANDLKELRNRVVLTETILTRWGELDPGDAFEHISNLPEGATKVQALRGVIPSYAGKDIRALAAAALRMKPGRARTETVQLVAEEWTRRDVKAALEWVNALPEGFPKEGALRNAYFVWVHLDPAGIASIVQNLPAGTVKNALIINVAGDWAAKDAASAIKWAEGLPEEEDKQVALATVAESWADSEPLAAGEFARKLAPEHLRQRAVLAALERWATQDPRQAISWIAGMKDVALQQQGVARILNVFVPVASEEAGRCVEQLAVGPVRESAIETYVEAVRIWNPGAGVRMAMKAADPSVRERLAHPGFVTWLSWDPESARQWLKEAGLAEAVKQQWLTEKAERDL